MFWEELTSEDFAKAVKEHQVCVIPMGVVEKHGDHLPLATDMIEGRKIAELAAAIEPFVIFPYYYFGQINEARHTPGTIAVSPKIQLELLEEVVKEIRRNGFKKIVLLESHGGNIALCDYFLQGQAYEEKDYVVYKIGLWDFFTKVLQEIPDEYKEETDGHAGRTETEWVMAARPELVHMERENPEGAVHNHRMDHLSGANTGLTWYSAHPTHQESSAANASREVGELKYKIASEYVADIIRRIKEDTTAQAVYDEYFDHCRKVTNRESE